MKSEIFQSLGLKRNPFPPGACKEFYFHSEATKRALEELAYGVRSRKGFMLLTGEVGYGKTSLLLQLMPVLDEQGTEISWVFNTFLNTEGLLRSVVRDFGLKAPEHANSSDLVDLLYNFFMDKSREDRNCVIVVDEAHHLSLESLESLRMLSNLELDGEKLVQIFLVGQPELLARLQQPELRQFRSRINIFLELPGLSKEETGSYINFKLSAAGSHLRIESQALDLVWRGSAGCLRLINLIMEKSLYALVAMNEQKLTPRVIRAAVKEVASCHDDVAARLARMKRRRWSRWAVVAAVALMVPGMILGYTAWRETGADNLQEVTPLAAAADSEVPVIAAPGAGASTEQVLGPLAENGLLIQAGPQNPAASAPAVVDPAARSLNAAISSFLEPLGVMHLAMDLRRGLENHDPNVLEGRLPEALEILSLSELPPGRDILYQAFPWKRLAGGGPDWLVLWRPKLRVVSIHPDHGGEEVALLQGMLKDLGYYFKKVDGVFCPGTWDALRDFQAHHGLPASGQPDAQTRLWLTAVHEQGKDKG